MSNNPNDKKDVKDAGLLSAAIAAAPAAGGFAYGLREMMKHRQFRPPRESSFASATRRVQSFGSGSDKRGLAMQALEAHRGFFSTPQGAEVARMAWAEAVGATDPRSKEILNFAGDILSMPSGDVYSAIARTVEANQSHYMFRSLQKFNRNVTALQRQLELTKTIPNMVRAQNLSFPGAVQKSMASLPTDIATSLGKIKSSLKGHSEVFFRSRGAWEQMGLGMYTAEFAFRGGKFKLRLPYTSGGVLADGATQSALRIARQTRVWDPTSRAMGPAMLPHQFMLEEFEKTVLPHMIGPNASLKSATQVQAQIDEIYKRNILGLEAIPATLPLHPDAGWSRYAALKSNETAVRVFENGVFRNLESREREAAMTVGNLIPSVSPSGLADDVYSTFDPRPWFMIPDAVDMSRRPMQVNRAWIPTPEAVSEMMKTPWAIFETQAWRTDMGPNRAPHFRSLYLDPERHRNLLEQFAMGEGESILLADDSVRRMTEVQRAAFPQALKSYRADLPDLIKAGHQFKVGEVLGITPEGTTFTYGPQMRLKGMEAFKTQGQGEFMKLIYDEIHQMDENEKVFGGTKGMRRMVSGAAAGDIREAITRQFGSTMGTGVQAIINMDELKKQPARHAEQMVTDMWDILDRLHARDRGMRSARLQKFLAGPGAFASELGAASLSQVAGGTVWNPAAHEKFTRELMRFAVEEGRLDPHDFGRVFGAVPYVLGAQTAASMVPNATFFNAMNQGAARGVSMSLFGGTKEETGAGAFGSLEPRAFEILSGGQYGKLGEAISDDLLNRLTYSNPNKVEAFKALGQTLSSVQGAASPGADARIFDLSKKLYTPTNFQEFMNQGDFWLRTGQGMNDIFVPGASNLAAMTSYKTAGDSEVRSNIANIYHDYARTAAGLYGPTPIGRDELRGALNKFVGAIGEQHAPAGKGAGAFMRGKHMLGSRFFTGVSQVAGQRSLDPFTALIGEHHADEMFQDMLSSGLYDRQKVMAMQRRFMEGEAIGGVLARHPFIGQYSLQPMNFRMARGVRTPVIALPSRSVNIGFAGEEGTRAVNLTPLAGLAGDLDADIFSATLVNPELSDRIMSEYTGADDAGRAAYIQHSIRAQMIKAKSAGAGAGGEITTLRKMVADAKKLGTAQEWVGQLSVNLSNAREAVGNALTGQESANARFMLEWLEQVPISGKHLPAYKVLNEEMSEFFKTLGHGVRNRDTAALKNAFWNVMRDADPLAKRMLTEDVAITSGLDEIRSITGLSSMGNVLPALNVDNTFDNIIGALNRSEAMDSELLAKLASGRKPLTTELLPIYVNKIGGAMNRVGTGSFSAVTEAMLTARNIVAAAGESLIKHKKAVGFGFAGSIALSMMLSSPKDTLGPGSAFAQTRVDMNPSKGANRMPTPLPPGQELGNPTVPNMMHTPRAAIAPGSESVRMSVTGRSRSRFNGRDFSSSLQRATGRNSNTNVNVRDNTNSMNPHILANKLF